MSTWNPGRRAARAGFALAAALGAIALGGCLGEPELEDRWTRIDLMSTSVQPLQVIPLGTLQPVTMSARITYRSIITGFAVAELRVSHTLSPGMVQVNPDAPREQMAQDIDRLLQQSVSVGRATRAVTGWDHLMQDIDFSFAGAVPATVDSAGGSGGLFLLCYLGSGQKVELQDGRDSIIVTPFVSSTYELLPVGMGFTTAGPGAH